ncbi:iron-sulfur cluster repair di-iron protein [Pedobacter flavus]|uniref:Iron-sulfur cluster repair di-iron protein n=1 Tax=Pedobacter flavus TaxID=3113906 RepID=A0ABU7H3Z5_9SPHI|nr:iron-sulfur cluster repair di-iron protein [Pedobacter sp. VNH31]MEE1885767.1 iron-sulfur cluster repair di-iron protein [Pedobacter sp. VNH31]
MSITKETIIGQLVANDYRTASVFKQKGIDFCCNGNRTIEDACKKKGIAANSLINELTEISTLKKDGEIDYKTWPLDLLADYIEKKHHRYVESKIVEIIPFLDKVMRVHGGRHPELLEIGKLFKESASELTGHMKKEEQVLFPYVRKMIEFNEVNAPFGTVQNPIRMMMHEHENEGDRFRKIAELSNNYTPPADACNTYKVTFHLLKEFEEDLHLHIHLENNILFPKSIAMEQKQTTANSIN